MRRFTFLLASFILLTCAFAEAKTIRINEARVQTQVNPGQTFSGTIAVTNPNEVESTVRVYVEDWKYQESGNGDKIFGPPGTMERSASQWITFYPTEFTLPPYGESQVSYSIHVPENAGQGTFYSVLFFETALGVAQSQEGAAVEVSGRIGSLIYVDIANTVQRTAVVEELNIRPGKGPRPTVFDVTFRNTGNTIIAAEADFVIFDKEGTVKGRGELEPMYTREGMTVSRRTEWPGSLQPGQYDVVVTFRLGENEVLVEEKTITVE